MLSREELLRYSRHFALPQIGEAGQKLLKKARILCVGAGGLGSPSLLYLTAAGIGMISIIDDDKIELPNLPRQILYDSDQAQKLKITAAQNRLGKLNPNVNFSLYDRRLTKDCAEEIISDHDIVLDGSDNFSSRYLINDVCFHLKIPYVYASVFQFEGQCSVFNVGDGPCYHCIFDVPPPVDLSMNAADVGIFNILPGIMGTIQAAETIKLLLGIGLPLTGRLLIVDALQMCFQEVPIMKKSDCRLCGRKPK